MRPLTDSIEQFIKSLLEDGQQQVDVQRNELAQYFRCAPSQITYVLSTRFTPDHGYVIDLDTPADIGGEYYDDYGNLHHNCVILYRTHNRFYDGDAVSGRMYLDPDYSKAICAYHAHLDIPEGVCEKLD